MITIRKKTSLKRMRKMKKKPQVGNNHQRPKRVLNKKINQRKSTISSRASLP